MMPLDNPQDNSRRLFATGQSAPSCTAVKHKILIQAITLNVYVFALLAVAQYSQFFTAAGAAVLILCLFILSLYRPKQAFCLLFGIKLTYDALWFVDPSISGFLPVGLLELTLLPLLVLTVTGPKLEWSKHLWAVACVFVYLMWIVFSGLLNGHGFDVEVAVRQAGMLFGLTLGLKYIRTEEDFEFFARLVFVSTLIPVSAGLLQIVSWYSEMPISLFYFKVESVRGHRPSGLYYDSGTAGMAYLMSIASGLYLFLTSGRGARTRKYLIAIFLCCSILIFAGSTLSITAALCVCLAFVWLKTASFGKSMALLMIVGLALHFSPQTLQHIPFTGSIVRKVISERERFEQSSGLAGIGRDPDSRRLLTGRVGVWQDSWEQFKSGTSFQQLFGQGATGSHSSYFFLLLQIGVFGLFFYLAINVGFFLGLWRRKSLRMSRFAALLSLTWVLLIGVSLSTVMYTSFQWLAYLMVGAVLNIGHFSAPEPKDSVASMDVWYDGTRGQEETTWHQP